MGKKSSKKTQYIFLLGMLLSVIGFCCPMFKGLGFTTNGFKFINFDKSTFVTIGALLIFCGACLGVVAAVLPMVGIKIPSILGLCGLAASIVGGIVLFIGFQDNGIYKFIGKQFLKHAQYGFYMVVAGWIVSVIGIVLKK